MECDVKRAEQERDCGRGKKGRQNCLCLKETVGEKGVITSSWRIFKTHADSVIIGAKLRLPHEPESVSHL